MAPIYNSKLHSEKCQNFSFEPKFAIFEGNYRQNGYVRKKIGKKHT